MTIFFISKLIPGKEEVLTTEWSAGKTTAIAIGDDLGHEVREAMTRPNSRSNERLRLPGSEARWRAWNTRQPRCGHGRASRSPPPCCAPIEQLDLVQAVEM